MPKCYVVGNIHVTDPEGYQKYASQVQPVTDQFGGRYLVRGGTSTPKDGTPVAVAWWCANFPIAPRPRRGTTPKATNASLAIGWPTPPVF